MTDRSLHLARGTPASRTRLIAGQERSGGQFGLVDGVVPSLPRSISGMGSEPAMVLLAPPGGGDMIKAVGDRKPTEKGRYAVVCVMPTGVDPATYFAAAEPAGDGPPTIPGAGPSHVAQGMFGQIPVT